jgi:hypothetical protein
MKISERELRRIIKEEISRINKAPMHASTGKEIKGGASVDKVDTMLHKIPGLQNALKSINTKEELGQLIQHIINAIIETGVLNQSAIQGALSLVVTSAKNPTKK